MGELIPFPERRRQPPDERTNENSSEFEWVLEPGWFAIRLRPDDADDQTVYFDAHRRI